MTLWLVFWGFKLITGRDGMGAGDFKMLAMLGAWGGWNILCLTILLASVSGVTVSIVIQKIKPLRGGVTIPFGPYLAAGGFVAVLYGDYIIRSYML